MAATRLRAAPAHVAAVAAAALVLSAGAAPAQTYGFATLPAGSLSHVISSAISKAMKEKAGLNVLVKPAAGGNVSAAARAAGIDRIHMYRLLWRTGLREPK